MDRYDLADLFNEHPGKCFTVLIVTVFVVMFSIAFCVDYHQSAMEAQTFNKFKSPSQPEATVWDAMFADLRVEAGANNAEIK